MPDNSDHLMEQWWKIRRHLIEIIADAGNQSEVERISKNWERLLRCEKLARELAPPDQEEMIIDVSIEGL